MDNTLKILLGIGVTGVAAYYLWPSAPTPPNQIVNTSVRQPIDAVRRTNPLESQLSAYDVNIDPAFMRTVISELADETDPTAIDSFVNIAIYNGNPLSALLLRAKASNLRELLDNESFNILLSEMDPDALFSEANIADSNGNRLAAQYLREKELLLRPPPVVQPRIPGEAPMRAPAPTQTFNL